MLYIAGTPIGNLDDISLRLAKTLCISDIILAEDTRSAQTLIQGIRERFNISFNPDQKLISYYKEKEFEKLPYVIEQLKSGKVVSLISESGMPVISDPGYLLVSTAVKQNIPVTVIPGPSAVTTSLIYSGFNPGQFMFLGFLPKKPSEINRLIDKLHRIKQIFPGMVFVFFESPQRIQTTFQCFKTLKWNPDIVICREMTKKFEEIIRGKADELAKRTYRGEITIILN